jgi:transcriptional regulator with GAF, ATPase, and Fis domain
MKRRSKVSGTRAKAQGRNATRVKRRAAPNEPTSVVASAAGERGESAGTIGELNEAREQLQAISEVLRAIGSSHGQLEPIFQSMLKNATLLCEAKFGALYLRETDGLRVRAMHGAPAPFVEERRRNPVIRPRPGTILADALATMRAVQIADVKTETDASSATGTSGAELAQLGGARTVLAVPMIKETDVVGALTLSRHDVRPFTEKQIELVENFAAQAVIAIENARLLNELRQRTTDLTEALEQQTATSEVLQTISGSPGDLEPVFVAMLEKAIRICEADFGNIFRWDGDALHLVATHNTPPAFAGRISPYRPPPFSPFGRMLKTKSLIHIADIAAERGYVERRRRHEQGADH